MEARGSRAQVMRCHLATESTSSIAGYIGSKQSAALTTRNSTDLAQSQRAQNFKSPHIYEGAPKSQKTNPQPSGGAKPFRFSTCLSHGCGDLRSLILRNPAGARVTNRRTPRIYTWQAEASVTFAFEHPTPQLACGLCLSNL